MAAKALLLLLFSSVSCSELNVSQIIENDPQCLLEGQQCSLDGKHIIYCTGKNGNSYIITSCAPGETCRKENNNYICTAGAPTEKETLFICQGDGVYPDGNKCGIGYICTGIERYPDAVCRCPTGMALMFYPKFVCTNDPNVISDCGCPDAGRCINDLRGGSFGVSCHIQYFYTCKGDMLNGFTPQVHKCPPNQMFIYGKCSESKMKWNVLKQEDTVKYENPKCEDYFPTCIKEPNVRCQKPGEYLSHSIQHCYYYCNADLEPIVRDCGPKNYFVCINGQCGCRAIV